MDRKSIVILVVCGLLFLLWSILVPRLYPPQALPRRANQTATTVTTNLPPPNISATTNPPVAESAQAKAPEELMVTENSLARYTFTSSGGGLKLVELKGYREVISCREKNLPGTERFASLNTLAPEAVLELVGGAPFESGGVFKLTEITGGVRAEKTFSNGLTVVKEFRPTSNYLLNATVRLENHSQQTIVLPARECIFGTATPVNPKDKGQMLGVTWYDGSGAQDNPIRRFGCVGGSAAHDAQVSATNLVWAAVRNQFFALAIMTPSNTAASEMILRQITLPPIHNETNAPPAASASAPSLWFFEDVDFKDPGTFAQRLKAGEDSLSVNLFSRLSEETKRLLSSFGGGQIPKPLLQSLINDLNKILPTPTFYQDNPDFFAKVTLKTATRRLLNQNPTRDDRIRLNRLLIEEAYPKEIIPSPVGFELSVSYAASQMGPGQANELSFFIYGGPREYRTVNKVGLQFNNNLDAVMGYGGFFGFFAKALLLSMNGLHELGLSYGAAIIAITVIIKLLFWPLTQASTRSMKRMQALQPQIKAIQEKYKDDPMKSQRKVMELWKEHKISPLGGCLPMLLQLPVFFGFYTMIQSAIELRGAKFLWVCDLTQPDTVGRIHFLAWDFPFNLMPLLNGLTMLWQARLTPPSPGMDPAQQKIMKYMPLMILVFLYNFSAGLTLYWSVQNLLTIAQTKLTRAKEAKSGGGPKPPAAPPPRRKK